MIGLCEHLLVDHQTRLFIPTVTPVPKCHSGYMLKDVAVAVNQL